LAPPTPASLCRDYWAWADDLREPSYYNVVLDVHLYTAFDGFQATTPNETIVRAAQAFGCRLLRHAFHHPTIVGEWSLATGRGYGGQAFGTPLGPASHGGVASA
jgi:hypothetical protein